MEKEKLMAKLKEIRILLSFAYRDRSEHFLKQAFGKLCDLVEELELGRKENESN